MQLYVPKWDLQTKKRLLKYLAGEDSLRFNSYEEEGSVNKYSVNWCLPDFDYISNTLLKCNVFEIDEKILSEIAHDGYIVIAIPLYDTVIYAVEAVRNVMDMKHKLEYETSYSNYIYFKS